MIRRLFALSRLATLACLLTTPAFAADVTSVQCTIKSVEPTAHSITVAYKAGEGEKSITLDVSRKAKITIKGQEAKLDALTPGDKATVEYNKELAIVTKIEAAGESVDGWQFVIMGNQKPDPSPDSALMVAKDGMLVCTGQPGWMLVTNRSFSEMAFTVEFMQPATGRANGVIIVATANPADGLPWAKDHSYRRPPPGIEIKLQPQKAGELALPREDFQAELPLGQIRDGRTITRVRNKDVTPGKWHKLNVECNSHGNVTVKLNGELVNAIAKAEKISGRIAIWPIGCEVRFRVPTVTVDGKEEKLEFNVTGVVRPKE